MKKARLFLMLGIWVAILPYLGFPSSWKNVLCTLSGLALVYYSYVFYNEYKTKNKKNKPTYDNFSENMSENT